MFGGLAFLDRGPHGGRGQRPGRACMVRVDPEETEALPRASRARAPFEMRGREMRGWLRVDADEVEAVGHPRASSTPGDFRRNSLDKALDRGIDRLSIARRQQVEQQAADDGEAEAGLGAGHGLGPALATAPGGERRDPRVDDPVEERQRARGALERPGVDLEEQPLEGPQRRVGRPAPTSPA